MRISKIRKAVTIAVGVGLMTSLAACSTGTNAEDATDDGPKIAVDDTLAEQLPSEIAERGTLRVGVALGTPPSSFKDENGEVVGYEIDLVTALAESLGLEVDLEPLGFDTLIPSLESDRIDTAIGDLGANAERQQVIDQIGWLWGNQLFAAPTGSDVTVEDLSDLCGHSVAVTRGSRQYDFAIAQNEECTAAGLDQIEVQAFQDGPQAVDSMLNKRSDLAWLGSTTIRYFIDQSDGIAEIVGEYSAQNFVTVGLQKDSELSPVLRDALQALIDDGTYTKLLAEWGLDEAGVETAELNVVPNA